MNKLAIAFAALTTFVTGGSALPPGHSTIRLTAQLTTRTASTTTPGSLSVTTMQLYNKNVRSKALGSGTLACTYLGRGGSLGPGRSNCSASYTLPRGTLLAQGMTSQSRVFYALVIVGGTGIYSNVGRGNVVASTIGSNLQLVTFALQADG